MQLGKGRTYIIDKLPLQSVQGHQCRICLRSRSRARQANRACLAQAQSLDYKQAGVDIDAGAELVRRIQKLNPSIGGFSGLVPFGKRLWLQLQQPADPYRCAHFRTLTESSQVHTGDSFLVAGTDGVGTKLKLAFDMQTHDTIGIDLVAMSVNDIITSGAKPMFFLDYFATAKLDVDVAESVRRL